MIYYAIELPPLIKSDSRKQLRASLDINDDTVVIVQTSRLEEWKGQSLHLEALGRLSDVPNWVAWLVGGPQRPKEEAYLKRLKESAKRLGIADRVRFLGQRGDVPHLLRAADIHCQPNLGPEPFGITFIEAMQSGLPLVSTAIGAAATLIDDSCGVLVPESNPGALAGALRRLILDPDLRQRFGAGGPARARLFCDPATQLPLLYDGICQIIRDPASPSFEERMRA
jgi:glycosyltransferase involved in cell wall biosynthesis